tara:strand:- start:196 stop:1170 length:975 start_codon:yes stop_codon:yes gene_type:complete
MPPVQALRYDEARAKRLQMFALLHHIRRRSLHPGLIDSEPTDNFTAASARLTAAIDILRWIKARGERALIFVEYRDVQKWLAELIRLEFDLERVDIINGETSVDQRKQFTDRFNRHLENDEGFDVLVLGPRAAGTGLTLTAANHVIHLTRWWNPAVEEQCNDRTHRIEQTKPVTVHIPLAIHPKLGRGSFDCLLQDLMRSKRNLADSVLWPQESNESELQLLHDRLVEGPEEPREGGQFEALEGRDDLVFEMIGNEIMRVASKSGGSSVVIARAKKPSDFEKMFSAHDAALIVMDRSEDKLAKPSLPTASLPDRSLWPDYLLPD